MSAGSLVRRAALFFTLAVALPVGALALIDPSSDAFSAAALQRAEPPCLALTAVRERAQDAAAIGCGRAGKTVSVAQGVTIGVSP